MIPVVFLALVLLPPTFKDKPPKNGLILQIGGFMSSWGAYVVDFDSGTIRFYQNGMNKPPKMRKFAGSRKLDSKIISDIGALADQAIAANYMSAVPTDDMDVRLEVSKNGKITETQPGGPIVDEKQSLSLLLNLLSKQFHP
jgi:hypothetical protein